MTDSEILEKYQQPFPISFKVIGTGTGATDIIDFPASLTPTSVVTSLHSLQPESFTDLKFYTSLLNLGLALQLIRLTWQ